MVRFKDNFLGKEASATFIAAPVTRPIFSTGEICDKGNITIHSSRGAFVVSDELARPLVTQLQKHAKLSFTRNGPGGLYEFDATLMPAQSTNNEPVPFTRPVK